uniref:GDT1 family protein n=1 Tax=Panagrolaimus sp. JU765 TaxID=591449 RepID=A0AC34RIT1_9BILA
MHQWKRRQRCSVGWRVGFNVNHKLVGIRVNFAYLLGFLVRACVEGQEIRMKVLFVVGTLCVIICFFSAVFAVDETVPDVPHREIEVDKDGNLVAKTDSKFEPIKLDVGFYHAFIASFSVIIVSELGDKTWFIAAIMAMRHSRFAVFMGAMAALALMTVLSACLGWVTQIIPRSLTFYISTALFALFGLKMLHEGYHMSADEGAEEYEEANAEVQKTTLELDSNKFSDLESGTANSASSPWLILSFVSTIFMKSFMLTFVAEWGDRSQLTTIILAAREEVIGVILGGIAGHIICTGIAVIFGRLLAQRISIRSVTLIGGVVFLLFALSAFFIEPEP